MKRLTLSIFLVLLLVSDVWASGTCGSGHCTGTTPWTSDSTSYADVNYCVNSCAAVGDTVNVPAGTSTWTTQLAITKSVKLIGAGIDSTTILNGISDGFPINIHPAVPADDPFVEISGFTIDGNSNGGCIKIQSTDDTYAYYNFRIHHNKFQNTPNVSNAYMSIQTRGNTFGLVDNNQFVDNCYDLKPLGNSANSWTKFPGLANIGTVNYLYIENNTSTGAQNAILTSGEGARWVYRYNTIDNTTMTSSDVLWDAHGDTNNRGVVAHEIYENTVSSSGDPSIQEFKTHDYRGGTGIIYNNSVQAGTNGLRTFIHVREEYANEPPGYTMPGCGDKVTGGYIWNNKNSRNDNILAVVEDDTHNCIVEDTDWWDDAISSQGGELPASTDPVGHGNFWYDVAVKRPGTCTDNDSYWETDTKKLYRCTATNTWSLIYTPYAYPHSLASAHGTASPATISFSGVAVGSASTAQTVTVTSDGAINLLIGTITLTGTDTSQFTIQNDNCSGQTIAVSGSCTFNVVFSPTATGAKSASVSIPYNPSNFAYVYLSGNGSGDVSVSSSSPGVTISNVVVTNSITGAPATFTPQKTVAFIASGVTGTANISITYTSMPSAPIFYKELSGVWKQIYPTNQTTGITNTTLSGNTFSFTITDNSDCDSDAIVGTISDPIVLGISGISGHSGSGGGGSCAIATVAYGTKLHPHINVLRDFRDNYLLTNVIGKAFVNFYYKHSPHVANFISKHETVKTVVRWALTPIVYCIAYPYINLIFLIIPIGILRGLRKKNNDNSQSKKLH